MTPLQHILCPYDFSPPVREMAPYVRTVATRFTARVTLLSVVPPIWNVAPIGTEIFEGEDTAAWQRELARRLDGELMSELSGVRVDRATAYGDPAVKIVEYASAHAVDLIMMPTHGVGMFRDLLLGSVTAKVLHDAACPVWTATHAPLDGVRRSRPQPATIVCAVDGSAATAPLLRWAAPFATSLGATLKLLHVVEAVSDWPSLDRERQLQDHIRDAARARIEAIQREAGIGAPLRVAVGPIVDTVAEDARQEDADLVVIGRGALAAPLGRLRTHAYGIIRRSPCPVLSV